MTLLKHIRAAGITTEPGYANGFFLVMRGRNLGWFDYRRRAIKEAAQIIKWNPVMRNAHYPADTRLSDISPIEQHEQSWDELCSSDPGQATQIAQQFAGTIDADDLDEVLDAFEGNDPIAVWNIIKKWSDKRRDFREGSLLD